jgi:site-specific recombinase
MPIEADGSRLPEKSVGGAAEIGAIRRMALDWFPEERRNKQGIRELAGLLEEFCSATTLSARLDTFVQLVRWTRVWSRIGYPGRPGEPLPERATVRLRILLNLLEGVPELRIRAQASLAAIITEEKALDLFATAGIPTERGFLIEFGNRLMDKLLPEPREDHDLAKLLRHLFTSKLEVERFLRIPPDLALRMNRSILPTDRPEIWTGLQADLADAFRLLAARVQATGLAENLRTRGRPCPVTGSPFFRLARAVDPVLAAWDEGNGMAETSGIWLAACADCREEMAVIHRRLETEGVSVAIVFELEVLERCLGRMERILAVMTAGTPEEGQLAVRGLLGRVIQASHEDRSLLHLLSWGTHLLHRKIVERAGKAGEHYIARNRKEYRYIWLAAAGGGLVTTVTAAVKLYLSGLHLPAFQEGFTTGLNYAVSFLLLQRFGLILATKQPAMTAAALASIVREERGAERREEIVDFTARICHSQLAAALGNILLVTAGAFGFSYMWQGIFGRHFLALREAAYVVDSLPVFYSGTAIYACLTGVILWLASLAGGWLDNWTAYHHLPRAVAEHPLGRWLGQERLERWGDSLARNAAGWGTNISLGFMLGYVHGAGRFLGVPMDVRHVTLNTGTLALAVAGGMWEFPTGAFLWALTGVAVMFVCNLGVSFLLSLFTAIRAYNLPRREAALLLRDLFRAFLRSPLRFLLPPRQSV